MSSTSADSKTTGRLRIEFLDGMRGLAAVYVMFAHLALLATANKGAQVLSSPILAWITRFLSFPHYAVAVFIVLSGFCLMLPVVRSKDQKLPGGLLGFAKRRARRILPPYYAALVLVLALFLGYHFYAQRAGGLGDLSAEGVAELSAGNIVAHFLLIHDFSSLYSHTLDGPMWSVAWEWHIYFIFALVLLPVWRRLGVVWTTVFGVALGFLPLVLLPKQYNLNWTCPWYIGLFAFGMTAAVVLCSREDQFRFVKNRIFLNTALIVIAATLCTLGIFRPQWIDTDFWWLGDQLVGAFAALFILSSVDQLKPGGLQKLAVKGLEARGTMALGAFSYSLYLIHFPILSKIAHILAQHHRSPDAQFAFLLVIGIPVCVIAAYVFHLAFERPFMPGRPKTERQAEIAALVSPAP